VAKEYEPDDLAWRAFVITAVGIGAFVAAVFIYVL